MGSLLIERYNLLKQLVQLKLKNQERKTDNKVYTI